MSKRPAWLAVRCGVAATVMMLATPLGPAALFVAPALAAQGAAAKVAEPGGVNPDAEPLSAPVLIDGATLFRVRGITSLPAEERAAAVAARIETLAADAALFGI